MIELFAHKADVFVLVHGTVANADVYFKDKVDAAIEELKAENERLKKCEIWMKQHFYCEEVIACESAKNRRLKRALWLARADRAMMTLDFFTLKCRWFKDYMKVEPPKCDVKMIHKWATVQRKCRAKAEEYK